MTKIHSGSHEIGIQQSLYSFKRAFCLSNFLESYLSLKYLRSSKMKCKKVPILRKMQCILIEGYLRLVIAQLKVTKSSFFYTFYAPAGVQTNHLLLSPFCKVCCSAAIAQKISVSDSLAILCPN